jgi:hypothetical protein
MYIGSRRFVSLPDGAEWMKLDLEFAQGQGSPVPGNPDAIGELELFEAVSVDIKSFGREMALAEEELEDS